VAEEWRQRVVDPKRLAALAATGLLDSPQSPAFDGLTRLAAEVLGAPTALVSLVDADRQFVKSAFGLGEPWASRRETPLSHSFCKHVVGGGEALFVADARATELAENPAVSELGVIAYAGVPLRADGETIGAFCAIDHAPRQWSDREVEILSALAAAAEAQIALGLLNASLAEREQMLDAILNTMPAGVAVRNVDGGVLRTNPALERLLGRSAAVLRALDFWSITHPDDVAGDVESREELLAGERSTTTRIKRFRHGAGHYVWVRLSAAVIRDRYGRAQGTVAVIEDVTAQRAAEEAIAHQARIYETIARNIPGGGVLLFDRDMRYLAADGADLLASLGFEKAQLEGRTLDEVAAPENLERIKRLYEQVLGGKSVELESSRHGHMLRTRFAPVLEGQAVTGGIALIQDVTEQHEQSQHLERTRQLFEATIASVRDGVVVLDGQNQALYANRAYAELFGFEPEKLVGLTRADFLRHVETLVDDPAACRAAIERPAPGADGAAVELTLVRPKLRHVRRTITPLVLPDGPGHVVVWHDISVERELLAERERQALTDALTGLPNRRAVELELTKAFARAERGGGPLCVALLDVDHFKRVNDTFGHATGDAVLKRVASALDEAKRLTDTIGRWGGEEFIAVLPVPLDGGATFCERVRRRIASLTHEGVGRVTISIGVAELAPKETPEALLGRADERLYAAKSKGRDRVEA